MNREERKSYFDEQTKAGKTLPDPGMYQTEQKSCIEHNRNYSASIGLPSKSKYNANPGPGTYNAKKVSIELLSTTQGKISKSERKDIFED